MGALGGAWRVGGSFRTWVDFFVLWGLALFSTTVFFDAIPAGILREYQVALVQ